MAQDGSSANPVFRKFEIDAVECHLQIGEQVTPETEVGVDFETGEMIKAGCCGRVAAINFNASNHTLLVFIQSREDEAGS
jgi:hypothetical protein